MLFQLLIKVTTGIKTVAGIELVMIFTAAAFDLSVVARSVRLDNLVSNTKFRGGCLEQCWLVL